MILLRLCLLTLTVTKCCGYQNPWTPGYHQRRIPQDEMVDVINDLGLKLLAIHNENNDNNMAISPYGAISVLVALGEGLRGEAVDEIQHSAHIPIDISVIRVGLRDIHRHLKSYFIPEEGFLAGLSLSHENVTLNRDYEEILKFYGYDIDSFNSALYPDFSTTQSSTDGTTLMDELTSTTADTTTETERLIRSEPTSTMVPTSEGTTVTVPQTPTTEEVATTMSTIPSAALPTTTAIATTSTANQLSTTQEPSTTILATTVGTTGGTTIPSTTMETTTVETTRPVRTTRGQSTIASTFAETTTGGTTERITRTIPPTIVETTTIGTTERTTRGQSTMVPATTVETITARTSTTQAQSTTVLSTTGEITTAGTTRRLRTTQAQSTTVPSTTAQITATEGTTQSFRTTQEESATIESTLTPPITTTSVSSTVVTTPGGLIEASELSPEAITKSPTTLDIVAEESTVKEISTLTSNTMRDITVEVQTSTLSESGSTGFETSTPSELTSTQLETSTVGTTTDSLVEIFDVMELINATARPSRLRFGARIKKLTGLMRTTTVPSTTIDSEGTTEILTTDFGRFETDNRVDAITSSFENWEKSTVSSNEVLKRSTRSVVDYIIARYYDAHAITQRPPPVLTAEDQLSFLVNGKYREANINFMTYDTVLPFFYVSHLDALALRFPLDSSKYYLLLLLPAGETNIDKLICDLRLDGNLKYIIKNLRHTHVRAVIPSFMLKGYVILTSTFQKLGIRKVFEPRQADFSPMTADRGIYVTNIEQAITVTIRNYVDPRIISGNFRYLHQYDPVLFQADHPFLYFVVDSEIHVTLMAGKIVNPLNSRIR